jgi:hypothetical protein
MHSAWLRVQQVALGRWLVYGFLCQTACTGRRPRPGSVCIVRRCHSGSRSEASTTALTRRIRPPAMLRRWVMVTSALFPVRVHSHFGKAELIAFPLVQA